MINGLNRNIHFRNSSKVLWSEDHKKSTSSILEALFFEAIGIQLGGFVGILSQTFICVDCSSAFVEVERKLLVFAWGSCTTFSSERRQWTCSLDGDAHEVGGVDKWLL